MHKEYGIIGFPLTHSFSPAYFADKFARAGIDAAYHAYPLETIDMFPAFIDRHPGITGLNVTIPHKQSIIKYLDELHTDAQEIGAVNCIDIRDGKRTGYNTDVIGFERSLQPLLRSHHVRALVLGTGGSSLAIRQALVKLGISYQKVSRIASYDTISYEQITPEVIEEHTLIINTTPLGMYPHVDSYPDLPYESMTGKHLLYDLIYNPEETKFLAKGKQYGAAVKNGYEMLILQAEASWEIWNR
ncbi:MAG: shikimate dehydrogenase family protein [Flavipsychrobacter sp.]